MKHIFVLGPLGIAMVAFWLQDWPDLAMGCYIAGVLVLLVAQGHQSLSKHSAIFGNSEQFLQQIRYLLLDSGRNLSFGQLILVGLHVGPLLTLSWEWSAFL